MPPLVSIIIPSYQQARFLRVAVDSALAQDYQPLEVLVLDGGSDDGSREILHRGDFSYSFTYERPTEQHMTSARLGEVVVVEDQENNELRALVQLSTFFNTYLLVSRQIDGEVLLLLDETATTVAFYNQTEAQRGQLLSRFALVYLGFAVLGSVIAGLGFAAWAG